MKAVLSNVADVWTINFLDLSQRNLASVRDHCEEPRKLQEIECYKAEAAIELIICVFVLINCFVSRDHQQTIFVTHNRLCPLSKSPHSLFLTDNIDLHGIPIKTEWKMHAYFTLYFQVRKVHLITSEKLKLPVVLFFVALHRVLWNRPSSYPRTTDQTTTDHLPTDPPTNRPLTQ